MAIDIKTKVTELVTKISKDESLQKEFKSDPVKAVESLVGVDLPDDSVNKIVDGVKAKLAVDGAKGAVDKLKNLL